MLFPSAEAFLDAHAFEQVDCLICDIIMPTTMTGWELLQIARREYRHLPVIVISAGAQEPAPSSLAEKGIRYFFRKPFDGGKLLAALDLILSRAKGASQGT